MFSTVLDLNLPDRSKFLTAGVVCARVHLDGSAGPRTEVVHQVENQYSCDITQSGGGCCSSMRMGEMKLIIGGPGDSRTLEIPEQCTPTPGMSHVSY